MKGSQVNNIRPSHASRSQLYWLTFLICALAYELPIVDLTSMDRVNPRLFDIATIIGLVWIWPRTRPSLSLPQPYYFWRGIVFWYCLCAMIWVVWLPFEKWQYSIFFSVKYLQGLFVIYLALKIPLAPEQKKILHYIFVLCGVFLSVYCIPEYIAGGTTTRYLVGGKEIHLAPGTLLGPLGSTYGHIAGWSTLSFAMTLSLLGSRARNQTRWLIFAVAFFIAWPALASGSRTGLLSILLVFLLAIYYLPRIRSSVIVVASLFVIIIGGLSVNLPNIDELRTYSRSVDRLLGTQERGTHNTIEGRLGVDTGSGNIQGYSLDLYEWQGWRLPIIGGGFYVVPHIRNNELHYRVGYGVHNGYLFPFEQGGIVAFVIFIMFLASCITALRMVKRSKNEYDAKFALGAWMFFLVILLRNWVGNPFWQGAGMENFSTLAVLTILLACKRTE